MKYRELHNIELIELNINGAGEYFFPRPQFANKKINSIFLWNTNQDMKNENIYISIYSIEKKPLYVNIPAIEFAFDNNNNYINEVIDFDLLKITYTGNSSDLTLLCWFSTDEKIIDSEEFAKIPLKCKNLHIDLIREVEREHLDGDRFIDLFSADDADFLRNKKIRMITCDQKNPFLINLIMTSGNSFNLLPFYFFSQTPVGTYSNILPFIMNDYIDLDRSSLIMNGFTSQYFDLTIFYE